MSSVTWPDTYRVSPSLFTAVPPPIPTVSPARFGSTSGVVHATSTGAHETPYRDCSTGLRSDGCSSVEPTSRILSPLASATSAIAPPTTFVAERGRKTSLTTTSIGRHELQRTGVPRTSLVNV